MTKFLLILLLLSLVSTSAAAASSSSMEDENSIPANSELGQSLLNQARRLENNDDDQYNMAWMVDYSLVFQGCYSIKQWNENAGNDGDGDDDDVRIYSRGLVRFRLCPKRSCSFFCTGGHGDYVVDLATFVEAYVESKRRAQEYKCESYLYEKCDCEDDDYRDDGWDRDICEYQCFTKGRKTQCIDRNPYDDDEQEREEEFDVGRYMECQEFEEPEFDDDDGNNQGNYGDDDGVQYYVGPYCGAQGGKIFIGMFTDDTCTNFADNNHGRSTYKSLTRGQQLPYSTKSVVDTDCISCLAPEDPNRQNENDNNNGYNDEEDEIELSEACEKVYETAGKCEKYYKDGVVPYPNNNGCQFIQGIKITRADGFITKSKPSLWANALIVLFAFTFCARGYYAWYLRKKLILKRGGSKGEYLL